MQDDPRRVRRRDALSATAIVRTAIAILDEAGDDALTVRALAARLATGPGAIYHHVASKDDLRAEAAARLVAQATRHDGPPGLPGERLRAVLLGVFDTIDAHPWLGSQLSRDPSQTAVMHIFERVGEGLATWAVIEDDQFAAATALVNYLLGTAGQFAAAARLAHAGRADFTRSVANKWTAATDSDIYPFVHAIADQLAHHDERDQFAAGLDLILVGITALPRREPHSTRQQTAGGRLGSTDDRAVTPARLTDPGS